MTGAEPGRASAACVQYAASVLAAAIARSTERRGRAFDAVRSLYVADGEAAEILQSGAAAQALVDVADPPPPRLPVALEACLSLFERATLSLLAGIAVMPRVDRVIGFLHDDLTRRSVTIGLLLDLFARGLDERTEAFTRLTNAGLLLRLRLVQLTGEDAPLTSRVQLESGVLPRLDGDASLDRRLVPFAVRHPAEATRGATGIDATPVTPTVLWGGDAGALEASAQAFAAAHEAPLLRVAIDAPVDLLGLAAREAVFDSAVLSVATASPVSALQAARALSGLPVTSLVEAPAGITSLDGLQHHRIGAQARPAERPSIAQPLPYGRRVVARRGLERLVLPASKLRALRSIAARVKHRDTVLEQWGLETGSSAGGIRCLFSGPPGTGKTLAAEAIAAELGRDLYLVDVSAVVSKYIGETEKILAQVFTEAARAKVCLFFDEADALFGKRGEQKDAHDKYANIETAYLLQAIDAYPDLVVLASNMRNNLDDALSRRIDVFVEFPMPDAPARRRLWEIALARAPYDSSAIEHVATRCALSGGSIQNAALAAAYEAAAQSRSIALLDLLRAARDEFAKSGKVAGRVELGEHYELLRKES